MRIVNKLIFLLLLITNSLYSLSITNKSSLSTTLETYADKTVVVDSITSAPTRLYINNILIETKNADSEGDVTFTLTANSLKKYYDSTVNLRVEVDSGEITINDTSSFNVNISELLLDVNGSAIQFEGTNTSYITTPLLQNSNNNNFTIDFWIKRAQDDCSESTILKNDRIELYYKLNNTSCQLYLKIDDNDIIEEPIPNNLVNNSWSHIALVFDETQTNNNDKLKLYLQGTDIIGSLVNASNNSFALNSNNETLLTSAITIGKEASFSIDDFKVWNYGRIDDEIKNLFDMQIDSNDISNLILYYNFEEGYGNSLFDITENYNGTIHGNVQRLNFLGNTINLRNLTESLKIGIPRGDDPDTPTSIYTFNENKLSIGAWVYIGNTQQVQSQIFGDSTNYSLYLEPINPQTNENNYHIAFLVNNGTNTHTEREEYKFEYNKWYYITSVFDSGEMDLYVNGVKLEDSDNTSASFTTLGVLDEETDQDFTRRFYIGSEFNHSNRGTIDHISQVSLWKKALSSDEINRLMHNFVNYNNSDLIGFWGLTEETQGKNLASTGSSSDYSLPTNSEIVLWNSSLRPTILGDTIYANDTQTKQYKIVNNTDFFLQFTENSSNASISKSLKDDEDTSFITYTPDNFENENFTLTGALNAVSIPQTIKVETNKFNEKVIFNLNNINSAEHDISKITLIGTDGVTSDLITDPENGNIIAKTGDIKFSDSILYKIKITAKNSLDADIHWYYNFTDNKIYTYDVDSKKSFSLEDNSQTIDFTANNWLNAPELASNEDNISISINENVTSIDFNLNTITNLVKNIGESAISSWNITEDTNNMFQVSNDGSLNLQSGKSFNREETQTYTIKVQASNSSNANSNIATITVNINDILEPPVLNSINFSPNENQNIAGTLSVNTQGDKAIEFYTLSGTDVDLFEVNNTTGVITLKDGNFDFEAEKKIYRLTATATSASGTSDEVTFDIFVQNIVEVAPVIQTATFNVREDTTDIGSVTISSIGDAAINEFHLSEGDSDLFYISDAGLVTLLGNGGFDYESNKKSYTFQAYASNGLNSNTITVTINILNVPENTPQLANTSFTIPENATSIGKLNVTSNGGGDIASFTKSGVDADLFEIDLNTYDITLKEGNSFDYESSKKSYSFTVKANNEKGASNDVTVNITLTNVPEIAPTLAETNIQIPENSQSVGNLNISSIGDTPIIEVQKSGDDAAFFNISTDGVITLNNHTLDLETKSSYSFKVKVKNSLDFSSEENVNITLTNVAETVPTLGNITISIPENKKSGDFVADLNMISEGDTSLIDFEFTGTNNEHFRFDLETRKIYVNTNNLDYDGEINVYSFSLRVKNSKDFSNVSNITINLQNIPDVPPVLNSVKIDGVPDNIQKNTNIGQVSINKAGDSTITRYVLSGEGNENFTVLANGNINTSSTASFNYNRKSVYTLKLIAYADGDVNTDEDNLNSNEVDLTIEMEKVNFIPTIQTIYDNYLNKNSTVKNLPVIIDDSNEDNISVTLSTDTAGIVNVSPSHTTLTKENYDNFSLNITPVTDSVGKVKITLNLNDGDSTTSKDFEVIVEEDNRFKKAIANKETAYYDEITSLTLQENLKFYSFENNRAYNLESNTSTIYYSSYKVMANDKILITKYKDLDGIVTVENTYYRYYSQDPQTSEISVYSDLAKESLVNKFKIRQINKDTLATLLTQTATNYTLNDNAYAYEIVRKENSSSIEIEDKVTYKGNTYSTISDFKDAFKTTNQLGLVRSYDRSKLLVFTDTGSSILNGSLVEINAQTGEKNEQFEGTWNLDNNIIYLTIPSTNNEYPHNVAFSLDSENKIARATYNNSSNYVRELLLSKELKKEVYSSLSATPKIELTLSNTINYISLPGPITLCDESIQSELSSICNQDYSLNSIFKNDSEAANGIAYVLKHDGNSWQYWDKDSELKVEYGLNKFTAISQKDGLYVKLRNTTEAVTIKLPFNEDDLDESSFMRIYDKGWYLSSVSNDKTAEEIEELVTSKLKSTQKLLYILILRDSGWKVYSKDESDLIDDNMKITQKIKSTDSFWINIVDK